MILTALSAAVVTPMSTCRHVLRRIVLRKIVETRLAATPLAQGKALAKALKLKMGRQPRSGDSSLAIGPFDPDWDRR